MVESKEVAGAPLLKVRTHRLEELLSVELLIISTPFSWNLLNQLGLSSYGSCKAIACAAWPVLIIWARCGATGQNPLTLIGILCLNMIKTGIE